MALKKTSNKGNGKKKGFDKGKKDNKAKLPVKEEKAEILFYYYMLKEVVSAEELAAIADLPEEKKEVWKEMNLTELILLHDSLVLEDAMEEFSSESDALFLKEIGVKAIYGVSYDDRDGKEAFEILKKIVDQKGGMICSDTDDFEPVMYGSLLEEEGETR